MDASETRRPWARSFWIAGLFVVVSIGLVLVGRWIWLERAKVRWSEHLEETAAWYEEHVGSLDLETYRLPAVEDEVNAGRQLLLLLEDFPLSSEERVDLERLSTRAFDFYRVAEEAEADAEWSDAEWETLRLLVARSDSYLRRLDDWAELSDSSISLVAGDEFPDELIVALKLSQLRLAEVAVRLEQGDCRTASELLAANQRLAVVLGGEPHFVAHMLGWVPERGFYEGAQRVLEAQLRNDCVKPAEVAVLQRSFDRLEGRSELFARAYAAEGAFHYSAMAEEIYEQGPDNLCFMTSSSLVALGELTAEASGRTTAPPPDRGRLSRTCAALADMLIPNLVGAVDTSRRNRYARELTGRLLEVVGCLASDGCELEKLEPFAGPGGEHVTVRGDGPQRLVELSPGSEDPSTPYRRRTLETITVPAELATAF